MIQKAKCSCDVVQSSSTSLFDFDTNKLYNNFINVKNTLNINLLYCYKLLFTKKGILYNYGSYSLIPILLCHFIIIIIFYGNNLFRKIKIKINNISFTIKHWHLVEKEEEKQKRIKRKKLFNKKKKKKKKKIIKKK